MVVVVVVVVVVSPFMLLNVCTVLENIALERRLGIEWVSSFGLHRYMMCFYSRCGLCAGDE